MNAGELVVPDAVAGRDSGPAWLRGVAAALAEGRLSVAASDAIRWGLGEPGPGVSANELSAAQRLVAEAPGCTVEQLSASARAARDELDEAGVAERERTRRDKRYLHLIPRADGMTRLTGLLDPESAATLTAAIDAVTAPRRGGPRFVEAHDSTWAHTVIADERTVEQMSLDALVDMVRIATLADPGTVFGGRQPAVQVLVSERDLRIGVGLARLEGQGDAVSVGTARRHVCEAGEVGVLFDDAGQAVNVGREQRCFTRRQRLGMAARDGGCRFPGCDRPPSWTEAHHIDEWMKHGGRTDLADGVLVCSHHHLLVHNNGWRFIRRGGEYWVVPPATIDPRQSPIPAPSKSAALRRLQRMTSAGAK